VYLIASHHGKVRLSLRSSPDESKTAVPDPCPGDTPQARGVREGDAVPACTVCLVLTALPFKRPK